MFEEKFMRKIALSDIDFGEEEIKKVDEVLRSKWISMGEVTREFEKKFAEHLGVKNAIAVSNGTAALHMACKVLGVKGWDEIIVPSLTFVATSNAAIYCGAKPVFADLQSKEDLTISVEDIRNKITEKTKGIIVMHYGGYSCDMKSIMDIAHEHRLFVVEDAAHAPGSEIDGKMLGTIGDIGCFSFFPNKNMATGEGGMLVTNNDELAAEIKRIRSHGMTSMSWDRYKGHAFSYDVTTLGYNYRLNDISSALGLCQLEKLEKNNDIRRNLDALYRKHLEKAEFLSAPFENYAGKSSCHIFPILLDEKVDREKFMEFLKSKGIQTSIHYPPIHLFSYYKKTFGFKEGMIPLTEHVGKKVVTLPLHPLLKEEDIKYVAEQILEFGKQ
jgi:dTDP-4-amino-4,6-dideoxygalactose transaminase